MGRPFLHNISKEDLEREYWVNKRSIKQIAKLFGVDHGTIHYRMKAYGIKRRDYSECRSGELNHFYGVKGESHPLYGENNPWYGVRGKNNPNHKRMLGENNPMWKGGITPEAIKIKKTAIYSNWRKDVLKRDGFTCQACGMDRNLNAHHIRSYTKFPDLRFDVSNGVTLCKECHKKVHGPNIGMEPGLAVCW